MAVDAVVPSAPQPGALSDADSNTNGDRTGGFRYLGLDKILSTASWAVIHPTDVVKARMQVGLSNKGGMSVFSDILKYDGIRGLFRGFGTYAIGRNLFHLVDHALVDASRVATLKYFERYDMTEAARVDMADGVSMVASFFVPAVLNVPVEVVSQRLMVQGVPRTMVCQGPRDVIHRVVRYDGVRGLYRGFGLYAVAQPPMKTIWFASFDYARGAIWRNLGYGQGSEKIPSEAKIVSVNAAAGMAAGASVCVLTAPYDTVKTRLQVLDDYGVGRPSVLKTAKVLLEEDGWRGFYRGVGPLFLKMSYQGIMVILGTVLMSKIFG